MGPLGLPPASSSSSRTKMLSAQAQHRRPPSAAGHAIDVHDDAEGEAASTPLGTSKLLQAHGGAAAVAAKGSSSSLRVSPQLKHTLVTLGYFALWFALNIYYNIVNKQVLNAFPLPVTVATVQLGVGTVYVALCWLLRLRATPRTTEAGLKGLLPIAAYHGSGQLFTVLSLGAAAVSFTHIVKAMEPFFSVLVAAVCFRQVFKP